MGGQVDRENGPWLIVFGPATKLTEQPGIAAWVLRQLPEQFQHVSACRWSPSGGAWLVLDVLSDGIRVAAFPPAVLAAAGHVRIEDWFRAAGRLTVEVMPRQVPPSLCRGPLTCVSAIKHLLGVRAWWIVTPRQLYAYLTREEQAHGRTGRRWAEGRLVEADRGAEPQGGCRAREGGAGGAEDERGAAACAGRQPWRRALAAHLRRRRGRAAAAVGGQALQGSGEG